MTTFSEDAQSKYKALFEQVYRMLADFNTEIRAMGASATLLVHSASNDSGELVEGSILIASSLSPRQQELLLAEQLSRLLRGPVADDVDVTYGPGGAAS